MTKDQLAILTAELATSTHPTTVTYNADNQLAADELNALNVVRVRESMSGFELMNNTDATEYGALSDAKKSQWLALCAQDSVNPEAGGVVQNIVVDIFGGGSTTVSDLSTARQETVSQATVLGLPFIYDSEVAEARA